MTGDGPATRFVREETDLVMLVDADFLKYLVVKDVYDWIQKYKKDPVDEMGIDYLEYFVFKRIDDMLVEKVKCKAYVFLFSGSSKNTFRYFIGFEKEYKGNRKPSDDYDYPRKWEDMAEIMHVVKTRYNTFVHADLEADDLVAVLNRPGTLIYSMDKDLKQLAGKHFNKGFNKVEEITPADGLLMLCYQLLAGDSTDNISGLPGTGDVGAKKILNGLTSIKNGPHIILRLYQEKYGIVEGTDWFVEQWMLVKLRAARGKHLLSRLESEINIVNQLIES